MICNIWIRLSLLLFKTKTFFLSNPRLFSETRSNKVNKFCHRFQAKHILHFICIFLNYFHAYILYELLWFRSHFCCYCWKEFVLTVVVLKIHQNPNTVLKCAQIDLLQFFNSISRFIYLLKNTTHSTINRGDSKLCYLNIK